MLENEDVGDETSADGTHNTNSQNTAATDQNTNAETAESAEATKTTRPRRRAASRPAGPPPEIVDLSAETTPAAAGPAEIQPAEAQPAEARPAEARPAEAGPTEVEPATVAPKRKTTSRSRPRKRDSGPAEPESPAEPEQPPGWSPVQPYGQAHEQPARQDVTPPATTPAVTFQPPMVVFQPPEVTQPAPARQTRAAAAATDQDDDYAASAEAALIDAAEDDEGGEGGADKPTRRRRRRGGRGRGKSRDVEAGDEADQATDAEEQQDEAANPTGEPAEQEEEDDDDQGATTRRRRRRRRRTGGAESEESSTDDPPNTVVHVREPRTLEDEVQAVKGSTRLEAKKQRRREGREHGRRRPPIITESEFLARRESVERVMVVRRQGERTQIGVLEDNVLVEHYVDRASHQSYVGNVYLGKVQNVLPSMEAAFVDVGKGRNAVLYAGEVNWDVAGLEGQPRRIESALKSGQSVLVQVTKDPLGHKGARLTSQISLPGRYLVYVPDGSMTGISRKLPDKERNRLKQILKKVMPENAGVIVRTAAEGAAEEELSRDVSRLAAQWENIQRQAKTASAPALLYGEPDLTIRVVRDIFNEDFTKLVVSGDDSWDMLEEYVQYVAPHLAERAVKWVEPQDIFDAHRIDEQIAKALERKVWLPSGGSLVIDRTEAMTVIDVNTGKFTGQGGNLEETVTRNNLEAAEEIVRQLRLRDIGGIVVVDFIDMVLESNRDLVLRRLVECLARDRTKHQVAEVTSLGLIQMTRKRVGQGLLEAFSEPCECCNGRGIHVSLTPIDDKPEQSASATGRRRKRKGDVERTVERKIARFEAAKTVAEASDTKASQDAESAEQAAEGPADTTGAPSAAPAGSAPLAPVDRTADLGTADLDSADGDDVHDDVRLDGADDADAAASNGRRRRPRRTRSKAEVGSDDNSTAYSSD